MCDNAKCLMQYGYGVGSIGKFSPALLAEDPLEYGCIAAADTLCDISTMSEKPIRAIAGVIDSVNVRAASLSTLGELHPAIVGCVFID